MGALRSLKTFIESFSFVDMVPDKGFVVSGFDRETHYRGLSQYGKQYALYIHHSEGGGGGSYTVTPGQYHEKLVLNLPPGDYKAEWIDPGYLFHPRYREVQADGSSSRTRHPHLHGRHGPPHSPGLKRQQTCPN